MPQLGHQTHQHQGSANQSEAGEDYSFRAKPIDHRAGHQSERQANYQEPQQKTLSELRTREPQGLCERGIKNRKSIKNDAHREK